VLGSLLGLVGCNDGVERNSVQVPERGGVVPGGAGDAGKAATAKGKRATPDSKVVVPGGKKA
jgi:hypothetical protein